MGGVRHRNPMTWELNCCIKVTVQPKAELLVTIHGLADKENPAVIDSGVFAWLIEVPVYF